MPADRVKPDEVFTAWAFTSYTGPLLIKYGLVCIAPLHKGIYIVVFMLLIIATKPVYLDLVPNVTASDFVATLWRLIGRVGIPFALWSDHGRNFAKRSQASSC